jgi:hypothetical protein
LEDNNMAYKFQLGQAKLSGSIVQTDGTLDVNAATVDSLDVSSGGITNAGAIAATSLSTSADLEVGGDITGSAIALSDASGIAGTGLLNNGGALDLDADGLTESAGLMQTSDKVVFIDASNSDETRKLSFANLRDAVFNDVSGDATVAGGGALTIAAGAVENSMLSGAIEASKLAGSIPADKLNLGNGVQDSGGNLTLELQVSNPGLFLDGDGLGLKATIGGDKTFSGNVTVSGDLTVSGTNTILNTTQLVIEDALITVASGAADLGELITAGAGIEFGDGGVESFAISGDIDGGGLDGFASSLPISASAFIGDGSALSGISADVASAVTFNPMAFLEDAGNIVNRFTRVDSNLNGAFTVTLPAVTSANEGAMYIIKDIGQNCGTDAITIAPSGSQKIEGVAQNIVLESDGAAVTLVSDFAGDAANAGWVIV